MEDLNTGYNGRQQIRTHKVNMSGRRTAQITGVKDVLSFDINEVLLETEEGMLMIKGKELHVSRLSLDKGEVDIDGTIDSLTYSESGTAKDKADSLFSRLFQ